MQTVLGISVVPMPCPPGPMGALLQAFGNLDSLGAQGWLCQKATLHTGLGPRQFSSWGFVTSWRDSEHIYTTPESSVLRYCVWKQVLYYITLCYISCQLCFKACYTLLWIMRENRKKIKSFESRLFITSYCAVLVSSSFLALCYFCVYLRIHYSILPYMSSFPVMLHF